MAGRSHGKISPALEEKLKTVPADEPIEVIVELERPRIPEEGTRAERIQAVQQSFDRDVADIVERMSPDGGKVLETAWINSTARYLATPGQIKEPNQTTWCRPSTRPPRSSPLAGAGGALRQPQRPCPCSAAVWPRNRDTDFSSLSRAPLGDSAESCCSNRATAPATCGVA